MVYKKKVLVKIPRQIQSDWNQTDEDSKDFIKNKPIIPDISLSDAKITTEEGLVTKDYSDGDIWLFGNKYYVAKIDGHANDIVTNPVKFIPVFNSVDAAYKSIVRKMAKL